jgi:hypothetical protein
MNITFFTKCVFFFHTNLIFASGTVLIVVFAWQMVHGIKAYGSWWPNLTPAFDTWLIGA